MYGKCKWSRMQKRKSKEQSIFKVQGNNVARYLHRIRIVGALQVKLESLERFQSLLRTLFSRVLAQTESYTQPRNASSNSYRLSELLLSLSAFSKILGRVITPGVKNQSASASTVMAQVVASIAPAAIAKMLRSFIFGLFLGLCQCQFDLIKILKILAAYIGQGFGDFAPNASQQGAK